MMWSIIFFTVFQIGNVSPPEVLPAPHEWRPTVDMRLTALTLICQPTEAGENYKLTDDHDDLAFALRETAVELELLSRDSIPGYFRFPREFYSDLSIMRNRYRDKLRFPSIREADMLPAASVIREALNFNRGFQQHLQSQILIESGENKALYEVVLEETIELYKVWFAMEQAKTYLWNPNERHRALYQLKSMLGDHDYYAGKWPPCVPKWRFRELE